MTCGEVVRAITERRDTQVARAHKPQRRGGGAYLMFGGAALAAAEMSCFMLNDGASFSLVRSCTCTITA